MELESKQSWKIKSSWDQSKQQRTANDIGKQVERKQSNKQNQHEMKQNKYENETDRNNGSVNRAANVKRLLQ